MNKGYSLSVKKESGAKDSAALSSASDEVDRLAGIVGQSREEHISQVREMIGAGTYNVSGTDIARKLIESNPK